MATKPDPRRAALLRGRGGRPPSTNAQILDAALRHAHWFERLKSGEANKVLAFLNDQVIPDLQNRILGRIQRAADIGFDTGPATTERLKALNVTISTVVIEASRALRDRLLDTIQAIARNEVEFEAAITTRAIPKPALTALDVSFDIPTAAQLRNIITATPFQGATLKEWAEKLGADAVSKINREIKIGLVNGESAQEIGRRVFGTRQEAFADGAVALLRRDADALTRTAIAATQHQGRAAFYEANADVLTTTWYWSAALDTRTCPQCQPLDGKTDPPSGLPEPPLHLRCRCLKRRQVLAWDDFARALGVKDVESLGLGQGELASMRASMNGPISSKIIYGEWITSQPAAVQNAALGRRRAELLRSGERTFDEFFDDRNRPLTLAEMKALDEM